MKAARRPQIPGGRFRGYDFTPAEWSAVCLSYGNRCAICRKEKPLTVDHIKPRVAGGTDSLDNIQPLCKSCNCRKSSTDPTTGKRIRFSKDSTPDRAGKVILCVNLDRATRVALDVLCRETRRKKSGMLAYMIRRSFPDAATPAKSEEGE